MSEDLPNPYFNKVYPRPFDLDGNPLPQNFEGKKQVEEIDELARSENEEDGAVQLARQVQAAMANGLLGDPRAKVPEINMPHTRIHRNGMPRGFRKNF